jgi:crossover junction endodeoxyribonuclease RuvC
MTVIAGIDPGTHAMGLAVVRLEGHALRAEELVVIRGRTQASQPERLAEIADRLMWYLKRYRPEKVAIERAFVGKNPQSAIAIGEARGVAMACAKMACDAKITEYTPSAARKAVMGKGNADKQEIRQVVRRILKVDDLELSLDASDAACLAIACAWATPLPIEIVGDPYAPRQVRRLD